MSRCEACLLAVLLLSCSGAPAGSCVVATTSALGYTYCIDYVGSAYDANSVKAACAANQSTYSPERCAKGAVGSCHFDVGKQTEYTHVYDTSAADGGTVDLEGICQNAGGTFNAM